MHKVPTWYWWASGAALLWALTGCFFYYTQVSMTADDLAKLPQVQRDIWTLMPKWVVGAYAVAVWSALAGALGLLLRRRWALLLFFISLIGIAVQFGWTFMATPLLAVMGMSAAAFPLFIFVAGIAMLLLSRYATRRGWLG
jgi:hypothetical protein